MLINLYVTVKGRVDLPGISGKVHKKNSNVEKLSSA